CFALLKDIKSERIFEEINKILSSDTKYNNNDSPHYRGVKMLRELNLLPLIFPEIELCYDVRQREDFHKYDVFEHTARTVKYSHKSIRLAALLHDIGKGIMYRQNGNFFKHEIAGSEKARRLLGQGGLKCPKKLIEETVFLIRYHMYDMGGNTKDNKIRLFIAKNQKYLDKLLMLKQADYLGCGIKKDISPTVLRWLKLQKQMIIEGAPFSLRDIKIRGTDILQLGCKEKYIKNVLLHLFDDCILQPRLNCKETLYYKAKKYIYLYNQKGAL
ncbi:MAG: HD domain-containing protein, partial [Clostridia bacterium]|nr:HD domain-containing protein [Clostridia bacterium]